MSRGLRGLLLLLATSPCACLNPGLVARFPRFPLHHARGHLYALESPPAPPLAKVPGPNTPALLPLAVLMLVPVAWGTYGVAIKSLFALDVPPPVRAAPALSTTRTHVAEHKAGAEAEATRG